MTGHQKQQAKNLYFQTSLSKTQIAEVIGVPRRTLHYWIKAQDWARLKTSSEHLPAIVAERCYFIIGRLTSSLLAYERGGAAISKQEADTLHTLTLTLNKLRNGPTLNENMETFGHFIGMVSKKSPRLAKEISPFIERYITGRAGIHISDLYPASFNAEGTIYYDRHAGEEDRLDSQDINEWLCRQENAEAIKNLEDYAKRMEDKQKWLDKKNKNNEPGA